MTALLHHGETPDSGAEHTPTIAGFRQALEDAAAALETARRYALDLPSKVIDGEPWAEYRQRIDANTRSAHLATADSRELLDEIEARADSAPDQGTAA